jgi:hypothetical protein
MLKWYCRLLVAMVCLAAAGCAEQRPAVTPADAAAMVRTGRALLSCRDSCLAEWQRNQPQAAQFDAAGRWPELAAVVVQTGYEDDLSLYYLGRAAQGLGYPGSAASYYRQSLRLSATGAACRYLSRMCGGQGFPQASTFRLAAIERDLNASRRRRIAPGPGRAATPAELPDSGPPVPVEAAAPRPPGTAPPWAEPVPPPTPAPGLPRPAAPAHAPGSASDFSEPPAAR